MGGAARRQPRIATSRTKWADRGKGRGATCARGRLHIRRRRFAERPLLSVDAGKHNFRSNDKQADIEIDAKAGQKYFIRVEIATGLMKGHGRVVMMAPEQGESEIKRLKPLESSDVRDREKVALPTF